MVNLVIVRHGYSLGNKDGKFCGHIDVPLDETGKLQAELTARYISENYCADAVLSSDLLRSKLTASPIAAAFNLPVTEEKAFREVNIGVWQGMPIEDVMRLYPEDFARYKTTPGLHKFQGGESFFPDVYDRVNAGLCKIERAFDKKTVVIVTHGGVIRTMSAVWMNISPENMQDVPYFPNGSVTVAHYDRGRAELVLKGYTGHLSGALTDIGKY